MTALTRLQETCAKRCANTGSRQDNGMHIGYTPERIRVEGRVGAVEYVPDTGTCRVVANDEGFLTCSNCGRIAAILSTASYCPNCGAKVVE